MLTNDIIRLVPADCSLAEALTDYHRRNRDCFRPFDPVRSDDFFTVSYQKQVLEQAMAAREQKSGFRFYIRLPDQPERIIGSIGLNNVVWGAFRSCFLGYALDHDHWNHGYMTMAVNLVTDYAFSQLGLHRIEGNVMPRNLPSLRVLEKCGYRNEGLAKQYLNICGVWEDHIHMVKLNGSSR